MTADSPASGLPQEAVDAAIAVIKRKGENPVMGYGREQLAADVLTAALPSLREQWDREVKFAVSQTAFRSVFHADCDAALVAERRTAQTLRGSLMDAMGNIRYLHETLDAERAKVAALQQTVDKVRELHYAVEYDGRLFCHECMSQPIGWAGRHADWPCPTVALLPDVQDDHATSVRIEPSRPAESDVTYTSEPFTIDQRGDDGLAPCDACAGTGRNPRSRRPATVEQPTGTAGDCGHTETFPATDSLGVPCRRCEECLAVVGPSQSDKGEQ